MNTNRKMVSCEDCVYDNYDEFDPEKGLAMAIAKKALGNKGNYFNVIKRWTDEYLEKEDK
nr:MAG TPA: hypothetical protein [Caudoviricetes sp.]